MTLIRFVPAKRATCPVAQLTSGDLGRFVEGLFGEGWLERNFSRVPAPAPGRRSDLALSETAEAYTFALEAPGFDKDSVKVEVEGDVLLLTGKVEEKKGAEGGEGARGALTREFTRKIGIPGAIAGEGHRAEVRDGILTVRLVKPAPRSAEPVRIAIN